MCMMVFMFDLMFIAMITVKMIVFIPVLNVGPMSMIISIMDVDNLLKKDQD